MNRATRDIGWVIVVAALVSMGQVEAQKTKAPPPPPDWPCTIVFDDSFAGAKIKSDNGGAYVNGVDGVQCIVRAFNNNIGNDGNLFVNASRTSPRWFEFPDNFAVPATPPLPRTGYVYFQNRQPGYFEITDLYDVGAVPQLRRVRVGVGGSTQFDAGEFWGDSMATIDPLTKNTHSATVVALSACTWRVTWDGGSPVNPNLKVALREGSRTRVRTGDFQLPFSAIVTVTSVKSGCTAP